ncbi:hypothetical protein ES706_00750 [subsurface metagenome]|nr:hypothetical protein [Hadesarchaea archaeon]
MAYEGILIGLFGVFISWWITRSYYKKTKKYQAKIIKGLETRVDKQAKMFESWIGADIRLKGDRRGTIVKRRNGTYAIDWKIVPHEDIKLRDRAGVKVKRGR